MARISYTLCKKKMIKKYSTSAQKFQLFSRSTLYLYEITILSIMSVIDKIGEFLKQKAHGHVDDLSLSLLIHS